MYLRVTPGLDMTRLMRYPSPSSSNFASSICVKSQDYITVCVCVCACVCVCVLVWGGWGGGVYGGCRCVCVCGGFVHMHACVHVFVRGGCMCLCA